MKAVTSGESASKPAATWAGTPKLGLKVPDGAIERVARRPRRQQALQVGAIGAGFEGVARAFDYGNDAFGAFAIARIGHAFAPPDAAALNQGRGHDDGFGLGAREITKLPAIG